MARAGAGKRAEPAAANDRGGPFDSIGAQASATVRQAAEVLEQELSSGLEETRRLQRRFAETGRLEAGDFNEVSARVRSNAHGLIDTTGARFGEMAADDVQDLLARFTKDAHEVFDSFMDLVESSPPLINRLLGRADAQTPTEAQTTESQTAEAPTAAEATQGTSLGTAAARKAAPRKAAPRKASARKASPRKASPRGTRSGE